MSVRSDHSHIGKLRSVLVRIENGFLIALIAAIVGMAVFQILLRNLFGTGIIWGDILVRILVLWIGMTGAMIGSRRGEHINVDLFTRFLPPGFRKVTEGVVAWLTAGVCGVAAYFSITFVAGEYQYGDNAFADVPVWICQVIIPIGFFVIALRYFLLGWHRFGSLKKQSVQ